jgi:hypothetical protein
MTRYMPTAPLLPDVVVLYLGSIVVLNLDRKFLCFATIAFSERYALHLE